MTLQSTDSHQKAIAAGLQLQQALNSAADALKTIANIVPSLFPTNESSQISVVAVSSPETKGDVTTTPAPPSSKRKRREKEPGAPEKPLTAYHLYAKEAKDQIKQAMGGQPPANEVILEVNRRWKELSDELKKPFIAAAEKLKDTYKHAMTEYEQKKGVESDILEESVPPKEPPTATASGKSKATAAKGGFTAVKASPLAVNPDRSGSEDDPDDEAAVAADLGGSQPPPSVSPTKRQRKDPIVQAEGKKEKKEKAKDKSKDKDKSKEKEKKRRRKSDKGE